MNEPLYPENAVLMAPLSGYTDLPYRRSLRRHGCFYAFTQMVEAASLACGNHAGQEIIVRGEEEPWLGVQLVGRDEEHLKKAVDLLNGHRFEVLDFNLGCPVPKVTKKGAGAALGRDVEAALRCFAILAGRSRFPLSAKIRVIDFHDPAPTLELVKGLAALGARAVTIHGRLAKDYYGGPVASGVIAAARELNVCQIIANGGVTGRTSAENLRRDCGTPAIMLARGAMGNPWLFEEIAKGEAYAPPTVEEWIAEIRLHVAEMKALYGEPHVWNLCRKIVLDYLKGRGFGGSVKRDASLLANQDGFDRLCRVLEQGPAAHNVTDRAFRPLPGR